MSDQEIITNKKNACLEKIIEIFDNNLTNDFIIDKVYNYVTNLDTFVNNLKKQVEQRALRKEELTKEKEKFTKTFLSHNQFYYNSSNNRYFYYDGTNYYNENEDEIHFKCATGITNHYNLNEWKQKTKISVLKEIKGKSIFNTIPETNTIQNVIKNLTPLFFKNKTETKYFLTIIGDNILKKGSDFVFFISPKSKHFLKEIQEQTLIKFGNYNIIDNFKNKYKDQPYNNIRLVNINNNIENSELWTNFIKEHILDLICVSIHYSNRYSSNEDYLYNNCRDEVKKQILFFKHNSQDDIVNYFIKQYLIIDSEIKSEITWKNMHFLWKKFLENENIPSVIYINVLKPKLLELLNNNNEIFYGITSKHLPNIEDFLSFWETNITYEIKNNFVSDIEISEIILLYNDYRITKGLKVSDIEEDFILQIIHHFMDNIEVENDKFILNIYSKLWDKENDVLTHLNNYLSNTTTPTIYSAYEYYIEETKGNKFIVNKRFFEKCFQNFFNYN